MQNRAEAPGPGAGRGQDTRGGDIRALVDEVYRTESRRVLATLIRLLGDFDLAEGSDACTSRSCRSPR